MFLKALNIHKVYIKILIKFRISHYSSFLENIDEKHFKLINIDIQ